MPMQMSKIVECNAEECAYNNTGKCHAMAITVGSAEPSCDTFFAGNRKGGVPDMIGGVGACRMEDCKFNQSLECSLSGVNIKAHADHADCLTYKAK
jgi:hypothetical protein